MSKLGILAEVQGAVDAAGTLKTFYLSNTAYATGRTDTPVDQPFVPALSDPGTLGLSVYGDGRTGGFGSLELGSLQVVNADGRFDALKNYGFDGRPITLRLLKAGWSYQSMPVLMTATVSTAPEVNRKTVTFGLKDKAARLDVPVCAHLYGGTNVLPNGIDGTTADIAGQPIPVTFGAAANVTAVCVNTSKQVFQVNDGPVAAIGPVNVRGAAYTWVADYANNAALLAATISAGQVATCVAEGLFRLNDSLAGTITADVIDGAPINWILQSAAFDNNTSWNKSPNTTVTANSLAAPDGTTTADTLVTTPGTDGYVWQALNLPAATPGNASIWARSVSGTINPVFIVRRAGGAQEVVLQQTLTLTTSWQRFSFDFTSMDATSYQFLFGGFGTLQTNCYVWGAQLTYGFGVQPYAPSTTSYGPGQNTNLLLQSQTFDNASWAKVNSCTVTADAAVAPDGTQTADALTAGSGTDSAIIGTNFTPIDGQVYNASVWLKVPSGTASIQIYLVRPGQTPYVVGAQTITITTSWQRFNFDFTAVGAVSHTFQIGGAFLFTNGMVLHAWGAQVTAGSGPQPYLATTTATTSAWTARATAGQLIRRLALRAGLTAAEISAGDCAALDAAQNAPVGIFINDATTTYRQAIAQIAQSVGGYAVFDPSGVLRVGRLTDPSVETRTPDLTLTDSQWTSLDRVVQKDGDVPIYEARVTHTKNWTVQSSDIAGSVGLARQQYLKNPYLTVAATDSGVKSQFLLAESAQFDTLIYDPGGKVGSWAQAEAVRLRNLYRVRRDMYEVVVPLDVLASTGVVPRLMSLVKVTSPRFGLSAGQLFWLLGFKVEIARSRATLTIWG